MSGGRGFLGLTASGTWGLVIAVAGLAGLAAAAAAPYAVRSSFAPQIAESDELLSLIESKVSHARSQGEGGLTPGPRADAVFVKGATPGMAVADLQRIVSSIAAANGMAVDRMQPIATDAKPGLGVLRMNVDAVGNIESLRGYLHALETSVPLIFVSEAHVAPDTAATGQGLPSDRLVVSLQVEAYSWWDQTP